MGFAEESVAARDEFVRQVTRQMCAGSEGAYREFYDAYFDRLYQHLLRATHGQEDLTREIIQNVFLRVVRYIEPFEEERRLWAWLAQLARSCHIDQLRRQQARPEGHSAELIEELAAAPEADDSDLIDALDHSLSELEAEELQLLHHAYYEKMSQEQIAAAQQTTRKAVESRLARIRQKLRKLILEKLREYALLF